MNEESTESVTFRFWRRSNEDPVKIVTMAVLVAFFCALLVASVEILLSPRRLANLESQRQAKMEAMLSVLPGLEDVLRESGADSLQTHLVDLDAGHITQTADATSYDQLDASTDPAQSMELPEDIDIAGIGRRANYAPVNLLYRQEQLHLVILPVYGLGYQSVIHAWLALSGDLNTVVALTVFEQRETPGLGARIQDADWLAQFSGKQLRDDTGTLRLTVAKGKSDGEYEIDGVSGATRTGHGINNMIAFWLGDAGFGPFLATLAEEQ